MQKNSFELIGKVNFIDNKISDSGLYFSRILLGIYNGKKDGETEYESVNITFFGEAAEKFSGIVGKGDYIHVNGRISVNKFVNKEGKEVKEIQLIANDFIHVEYNKQEKGFIEVL